MSMKRRRETCTPNKIKYLTACHICNARDVLMPWEFVIESRLEFSSTYALLYYIDYTQ